MTDSYYALTSVEKPSGLLRRREGRRSYLAPFCDDIQLHFTSAVCIGPGESEQILHRDRGIWGGYLPRQHLSLALRNNHKDLQKYDQIH